MLKSCQDTKANQSQLLWPSLRMLVLYQLWSWTDKLVKHAARTMIRRFRAKRALKTSLKVEILKSTALSWDPRKLLKQRKRHLLDGKDLLINLFFSVLLILTNQANCTLFLTLSYQRWDHLLRLTSHSKMCSRLSM